MLEETFKKYADEVCTTCKRKECDKGICVVYGTELKVQCVDYDKDETKIKSIEKPIIPTAKHTKPIMDKLV